MADIVQVEVNGLQLSNNTFSASPPGSLAVARDVVMPQKGVVEPRRGQDRRYLPTAANENIWSMAEFQGSLILNYASSKSDDSYQLGLAASPTVPFANGPYNPVDMNLVEVDFPPRMKFGFAGTYLYFCCQDGARALEAIGGTPRSAGLFKSLDPAATMGSSSATGFKFLAYGSSVGYQTMLRLPTSNGTSDLSPPSGMQVVTNRAQAPIGNLTRTIPSTTTVTAVFPGNISVGLQVGDSFTLSPGEANFPAGTYTIATNPSLNHYTYVDAHAAVAASSLVVEDFNTGNRPTSIKAYLTSDATTSTPIRLYRTKATTTTSPNPAFYLVSEVFPNNTDIANGYVTFTDTTPESVIFDPAYTNPSDGSDDPQPNYAPPIYRDIAWWQDRMWYLNTTAPQRLQMQLLGVLAPAGIQNNDTLTINDTASGPVVFTFKTTPAASTDVQITSDGDPSFNILRTTQALIQTINAVMKSSGGNVRAYYTGGSTTTDIGSFVLESIRVTSDATNDVFGVRASRPATWTPALDTTNYVGSTAEVTPNGLAYSKLDQPEAVPLLNKLTVGSKNYPALRVFALNQALVVFKAGDGIYTVSGSYPFNVQQISVANLIAPDAACVFSDNVLAYTDQGIMRISASGGATIISRQIETVLNDLRDQFPVESYRYSFAVPYEQERRVLFFVPTASSGANGPILQAYCYNSATQAWTGLLYDNAQSGIVPLSTARLTLGVYDSPWATARVTQENKGLGLNDYVDAIFATTISAINVGGNPRVIRLGSTNDVEVGDAIAQPTWTTKIKSITQVAGQTDIELWENVPATVAACFIGKGISFEVQFQPFGQPTSRKTLTRLSLLFKPEWFQVYAGTTTVMTDQVQAQLPIATSFVGFGLNPFGVGPFGNPTPLSLDINPIDPQFTNAAQFFIGFRASEALVAFKLQGFAMRIENQDGPSNRGK